jgi:hypothetical protein
LARRWKVLDIRGGAGKGYESVHRAARRRPYRALPTFTGGWRGLWACVAALLVATSPIASFLHRAFVPHVICEHGDLVEPGEAATPPNHGARFDASSDRSSRAIQSATPASHGHDHCSVGTLARHAHLALAPQLALSARIELPVALFRPQSTIEPRLLLLIAPKTSPPGEVAG